VAQFTDKEKLLKLMKARRAEIRMERALTRETTITPPKITKLQEKLVLKQLERAQTEVEILSEVIQKAIRSELYCRQGEPPLLLRRITIYNHIQDLLVPHQRKFFPWHHYYRANLMHPTTNRLRVLAHHLLPTTIIMTNLQNARTRTQT
jgi:hypothetical protein